MLQVPLAAASVDVAVFCLSLMGTSFEAYLREAQRVLVPGGRLVIAEVRSRFEGEGVAGDPDDDGADGDGVAGGLPAFLRLLKDVGFDVKHQSRDNKMFLMLQAVKSERKPRKASVEVVLKACRYKKR